MDELHDKDFYAWTQEQASVLRSMTVADNRLDREGLLDALPSSCPYPLDDILDRDRDWFPEPRPRPGKRPAARRPRRHSS